MGVRGFYHYSKPFQKEINNNIEYRVGIDALSLLFKYHGDIIKIFNFLKPILHNKLLFVFDGKAPESKTNEIQKRKKSHDIIQEKIQYLKNCLNNNMNEETKKMFKQNIEKLEYDSWTVTYEIRETFKNYLILIYYY